MKIFLFFWGAMLFILGCHSNEWKSDDIPPKENQTIKANYTSENGPMKRWIEQLTSPKFFEYTQAARKFLEMGVDAIPYLRENIHLMRESNDSVVPVCRNLIYIIFQQQKEEWVLSQTHSSDSEIQKIAKEEIVRRAKLK